MARRSSSCLAVLGLGRGIALIVVEVDEQRVGLELGLLDLAGEGIARALEIGDGHEQVLVALEELADLELVDRSICSTSAGGIARKPAASSVTAAARSSGVRASTSTSTTSVARTRASSLRRSLTAGASCGNRYEKSA